jgi:hypothetical protein
VLSSAIQHYVLRGNLRRAATQQQYLAELYEVELGDMKKALDAYEKAAEWFESDNAEAYGFLKFCYGMTHLAITANTPYSQPCKQALSQGCGLGCLGQ